jgi:TRAP-type C4-dicarboxylate transport system permease small subunit
MAGQISSEYRGLARRIVDHISRVLALVGMWLIFFMGLLIVADVIFRALNRPFVGAFEVTELLLCVCVFSAISYTWMCERHVRVTMFFDSFGPRMRAGLDACASLSGAVLFALIAWRNVIMGIYSFQLNDITWLARIPIYPVYIFIVLGSTLLSIQMFITCSLSLGKFIKLDHTAT